MASGKKYGLIIPKSKNPLLSKKTTPLARPSVFGNDSSSDEDAHKEVNVQIHQEALKKKIQKQTKIDIQKALEQDSTVYEYDSIYDDMKEKSKKSTPTSVSKADKQKKPKYIQSLLKAAEKRTKERERIEERKIQKEREKEGDEFNDKEEFVTSAYRQKMIERQRDIEEEKRMDAIEEALDVRKQKDLTGFYRNFLNRELCEEPEESKPAEKESPENDVTSLHDEDADTDLSFSSSEEDSGRQSPDIEDHRKKKPSYSPDKDSSKQVRRRSDSRGNHRQREWSRDKSPTNDYRSNYESRSRNHDRDQPKDSRRSPRRDRNRSSKTREHGSRDYGDSKDSRVSQRRDRDRSPKGNDRRSRDYDRIRDRGRYTDSRGSPKRDRSSSPRRYDQSDKYNRDRNTERHSKRRNDNDVDDKDRRKRRKHRKNSDRSRSKSPKKRHENDAKKTESPVELPDEDNGNSAMRGENEQKTIGPTLEEKPPSAFAKRTDNEKAMSARDRYLARKNAQRAKPVVESDSE